MRRGRRQKDAARLAHELGGCAAARAALDWAQLGENEWAPCPLWNDRKAHPKPPFDIQYRSHYNPTRITRELTFP